MLADLVHPIVTVLLRLKRDVLSMAEVDDILQDD
jgi:hypothetical protein